MNVSDEPDPKICSKRRRKRTIILPLVAGPLVLAGLAACWYISRDEPPPPDDSDLAVAPRPAVPDDQNGMTYFRQAGEVAYWPEEQAGAESSPPEKSKGLPAPPTAPAMKRPPLTGSRPRPCCRAGDGTRRWPPRFSTATPRPSRFSRRVWPARTVRRRGIGCRGRRSSFNLSPLFEVARVAALKAMALAHQGDGDAALRQAMDVVEFGQDMQQCDGRLIGVLVGNAAKIRGTIATRYIVAKSPLSADALKTQAGRLDGYADNATVYADSIRLSYQWFKTMLEKEIKPRLSESRRMTGGFYFRENETMRVAADEKRAVIAQVDRPLAEFRNPELPWPEKQGTVLRILGGNVLGRMLCSQEHFSWDRIVRGKCIGRTDARITQVLMALRLFKMKTGRLPETLDELVPDYLAAVPLDDFDGKPIRYSAAKKIVYTVGEDLKDDGGLSREEARALWQKQNPRSTLREDEEVTPMNMPDPSYDIEF